MSGVDAPTIINADCIEVMRGMPANSIDAIVTDPPYGLGFMGKEWDDLPPGLDFAVEALRVLKPGGHMLAFGGTRTWHRLAVAIEDGGFEIRDSIAWLYSSGFPKSMDVSKAIDKLDAADERRARALEFTTWMRSTGLASVRIDELTSTKMGGHYTTAAAQPAIATADLFDLLRPELPDVPARIEALVAQRTVESENMKARKVIGIRKGAQADSTGRYGAWGNDEDGDGRSPIRDTIAHTAEGAAFQGWGTALKPAFEPIVVARKPLVGTVAANVLAHGTGALNIDASRIGDAPGRFPANVILDESQAAALDEQSGTVKGAVSNGNKAGNGYHGRFGVVEQKPGYNDVGGASRFFYCAKAPKSERPVVDGVAHPTVKPLALMRYLVRLVTPPGGVVLDPFAGSGTTVEAALLEGFRVVGIERESAYLPLIEARVTRSTAAQEAATTEPVDLALFDDIQEAS